MCVCVCAHAPALCAQVIELATVKRPQERAYTLQRWHEDGGVLIIGYEMYRNLTIGRSLKSKKLKETFQKTLVDPGRTRFTQKSKYLNKIRDYVLHHNINKALDDLSFFIASFPHGRS